MRAEEAKAAAARCTSCGRRGWRCAARGIARRRTGVVVVQALGVGASVTLELGLNPVDRGAVAGGALAAVAELGEPENSRLVAVEVEPPDQGRDRIGRGGGGTRRPPRRRAAAPGAPRRAGPPPPGAPRAGRLAR